MNAQIAAVDFHGNPLTVITTDDNQHLVAMRPICEGIGLNGQGQHDRIRRHEVLNLVVRVTRMTASDGKQYQYVCLPIEYLNGWLFGIDAKRVKPEIRSRLIQYQKECFKVLADYWMGDKIVPSAANSLVRVSDGNRVVTTSKDIATFFAKDHADIRKRIVSIKEKSPEDWAERNFALRFENSGLNDGKMFPLFEISREGFMRLTEGFHEGKKAQYIEAFSKVEQRIGGAHDLPKLESLRALVEWSDRYSKVIRDAGLQCPDAPKIDDLIYDHIMSGRWLVSLSQKDEITMRRIPINSIILSVSDKQRILQLIDDDVPHDILPDILKTAADRAVRVIQARR